MQTLRKPLFFSVFAFLCISFSAYAQSGRNAAPGAVTPSPGLSAALCEMASWDAASKAERDSLMLSKAAFLEQAGRLEEAYATVCRIPAYGMSPEGRQELLRRKLMLAWSASRMDDFQALLPEYEGSLPVPEGRAPAKSEDAAMLLSILPGVGNAYAGDWKNAGKYLLINSSIIALGAGAFASSLYLSAFLGGGMLLYTTLPASTQKAVDAVRESNVRSLKKHYAPVYKALSNQ